MATCTHRSVVVVLVVLSGCLHQGACNLQGSSGFTSTENLNSAVDYVLNEVTKLFHLNVSNGTIKLPDLEETFTKHIGWFHVHGGIQASGGSFSDLSTVKRIGNASVTFTEDTLTLRIRVGIEDWKVNFGKTHAWFGILSITDQMQVDVGENSVDIEMEVFDDGHTCNATLNSLTANVLKDYKVSIEGLGILDGIADLIDGWVISFVSGKVRHLIEEALTAVFTTVLKDLNLCRIL